MRWESVDYHGALASLEQSCTLTNSDVVFVSNLMRTGTLKDGFRRKAGIAMRHLRFAWSMLLARHEQSRFLVREFSNVPLAFIFPLIRGMRDRMLFVVNHNLQWTLDSRIERAAFCWLGRQGCRFVFLEQVPLVLLEEYGIDSSNCVALPHPVSASGVNRDRTGGVKVVGVIGQFRLEKGLDDLLTHLASLAGDYHIVLAIPNVDEFKRQSRFSNADWFELTNTSDHECYLETIAACDVIVLSHPSRGYEYRASGLIADAAAAHVPVVVRNLPVLRSQVMFPVCIGQCFTELSEIADCIGIVSETLDGEGYDFVRYIQTRSVPALAKILDAAFATVENDA